MNNNVKIEKFGVLPFGLVEITKTDLIEYSNKSWFGRIICSIQLLFVGKGWLKEKNIIDLINKNPTLQGQLNQSFILQLIKTQKLAHVRFHKNETNQEESAPLLSNSVALPANPSLKPSLSSNFLPKGPFVYSGNEHSLENSADNPSSDFFYVKSSNGEDVKFFYTKAPFVECSPEIEPLVETSLGSPENYTNYTDKELWNLLKEKTSQSIDYLTLKGPFSDIKCPKQTAIHIEGKGHLHANLVGKEISKRTFIATQAPPTSTQPLFWQSAFLQEGTILDLTTPHEIKTYYPLEMETKQTYGALEVTLTAISLKDKTKIYHYNVQNNETGESKTIQRAHFDQWIDHQSISMNELVNLVDQLDQATIQGKTPCVHCRAGVGRTGTLITASILKEKIQAKEIHEDNLKGELIQIILALRQQRGPQFVQKQEQLSLLIKYGQHLLKAGNTTKNDAPAAKFNSDEFVLPNNIPQEEQYAYLEKNGFKQGFVVNNRNTALEILKDAPIGHVAIWKSSRSGYGILQKKENTPLTLNQARLLPKDANLIDHINRAFMS